MFAVASSRITTQFFLRIARQMQISCFSPELRFLPPSVIFILMPFSDSSPTLYFSSKSPRPASIRSDSILSTDSFSKGSRLNRRVPVKRVGSWGITVIFSLTFCKSTLRISTPSISIDPDSNSTILLRLKQIVDFPAPVRPTTPTFVPGLTLKLKSFKTTSVVGLYLRKTFLNSTLPS